MVEVITEIIIERPRDLVSDYAANPDHAPDWYVNIQAAVWQTPRPLTVGTRVAFTARFLGRELAYTYQIDEYVPGVRMVMRTAEGPFPMETVYTWEEVGRNSTLMTLCNRGEPRGFSKLAAPMIRSSMRKANRKDLERLKHILEQ